MNDLIDKICLTDAINDCCAGDKNCSECDSALRELISKHDEKIRENTISEVYDIVTDFLIKSNSDLDFNLELQNKILDLKYDKR